MDEHDLLKLHKQRPPDGSRKKRKRVGRGRSAGGGKTAGRGQKGAKSRSGYKRKTGYEGGQMPLARRVPKLGGFVPRSRRVYSVINVSALERFDSGAVIDPAAMAEAGLVKKQSDPVKVLGDGRLSKSLVVRAHAFTGTARNKIEDAGGKAEVI